MKAMNKRVQNSIIKISEEFKENRALYLSESDMKCKLFKLLDKNEKYLSNGVETYLIHTEIGLNGDGGQNKIDIYIAKFKGLSLGKKWKFDRDEDIGVELKYHYGNKKQELKSQLLKDKDRLIEYNVDHKYIVCFDHFGMLEKTEILGIASGIYFVYVDGTKKEIYSNL